MKLLALTILCALAPFVARAQQVALEIPGAPVVEKHVFGGAAVPVEIAVSAPPGASVDVQADLMQLADALAAPLQKDVAVAGSLDFSTASRRVVSWTVKPPAVKRVTRVAVQFRVRAGEGPWQPAGRLLLTVYPEKLPEWQSVTGRADLRVAVFGRAEGLRAALKACGVRFTDLGAELPADFPAGTVGIGEARPDAWREWLAAHPEQKGAFIVACPDPGSLPVISTEATHGLCVAKIIFPLFNTLAVDPRAQKTLADLINRTADMAAAR